MGSKGHFILGALFALLGIARFLTDGSAVFGWIYVGLGAVWCALGWRMKRREAAPEGTEGPGEVVDKRERRSPDGDSGQRP